MKRVYWVSLGCPKGLVDLEVMLGILEREGCALVSRVHEADLLMVNTCAFIEDAVEESIAVILELARIKKKEQLLVVAGCLPQRYGVELAKDIPEVDVWIDLHHLGEISRILNGSSPFPSRFPFLLSHQHPRRLLTPSNWAYIKVAEGCNNRCAYCILPRIRGPLQSRTLEDLMEEVRSLADRGVLEINLIAQDVTRYGEDLGYKDGLVRLLDELEKVDGVCWIRVMYAHPAGVTQELADRLGSGKVLPYLEMPIQHVSDKVLAGMERRGGRRAVLEAFERLDQCRDLFLRTTVMVGFPDEGEREFLELMSFLEEAHLFRLAAFAYSPEGGTLAFSREQLPETVRQERLSAVLELQARLHYTRNLDLVGSRFPVLMEGKGKGRFPGQAPEIDGVVRVSGGYEDSMADVIIRDADLSDLYGEMERREISH